MPQMIVLADNGIAAPLMVKTWARNDGESRDEALRLAADLSIHQWAARKAFEHWPEVRRVQVWFADGPACGERFTFFRPSGVGAALAMFDGLRWRLRLTWQRVLGWFR